MADVIRGLVEPLDTSLMKKVKKFYKINEVEERAREPVEQNSLVQHSIKARHYENPLYQQYDKYVLTVEHDLSLLDYMSHDICCLFGQKGVYGIVSHPYSVLEGINSYLDGYLPKENMKFREDPIVFTTKDDLETTKAQNIHSYPHTSVNFGDQFHLEIQEGQFNRSQIVVLLGQNGTGKTSFIRTFSGLNKE